MTRTLLRVGEINVLIFDSREHSIGLAILDLSNGKSRPVEYQSVRDNYVSSVLEKRLKKFNVLIPQVLKHDPKGVGGGMSTANCSQNRK